MPEPTARADRTVDELDRLIGARIRQERLGEGLRRHKPWTALVLLERVNRPEAGGELKMDPNVVRRIESGERPLRASQLVAFARALGVGVEFTALVAMAVAGTVSWARTIFCWFE